MNELTVGVWMNEKLFAEHLVLSLLGHGKLQTRGLVYEMREAISSSAYASVFPLFIIYHYLRTL